MRWWGYVRGPGRGPSTVMAVCERVGSVLQTQMVGLKGERDYLGS